MSGGAHSVSTLTSAQLVQVRSSEQCSMSRMCWMLSCESWMLVYGTLQPTGRLARWQ